ncbi:MAG: CIA30 family protein [Xanthomonadales bacterium]|nr:CIA30 family protein [Xanthomonadales bacterium]
MNGQKTRDHRQTIELQGLDWLVINDGVMGGRSSAVIGHSPSGLEFNGNLSLENGGGFSSVRAPYEPGFGDWSAFELTVTGDGRDYQFRLRESERSSAVAWRARFSTDGRRQTIQLPREAFEAVIRGRQVEALPGIAERDFRYLGFLLTSDRAGPFSLTVHRVDRIPAKGRH